MGEVGFGASIGRLGGVEVSPEFPWGVHVSNLCHPKTGAVLPALLPSSTGGLVVSFSDEREDEAILATEHIVANILACLPRDHERRVGVHVVDFSVRNRFQSLASLEAIKMVKSYHYSSDAAKLISELERVCVERHHELLTENFKSVSKYNRQAKVPEEYFVVVINLNQFPDGSANIDKFKKIIDFSFDAGIYFLFLHDGSSGNAARLSENEASFLDFVKHKYPQLDFPSSGKERRVALIGDDPSLKELLSICTHFGLSMQRPYGESIEVASAIAALKESKSVISKDFLSIPIGYTTNGRSVINFNLGDSSQCRHAFIIGMTGTGKSNLLDHIILGVAQLYSPNEVRLILMDFLEGVSFKKYRTHPNCEKIFLDNEDVAGAKSLIEYYHSQMSARADVFNAKQINNIVEHNEIYPDIKIPYLVLVVDEVQRLFQLADNKTLALLVDIARRGRTFGLHMIFSTQTLAGYVIDTTLMTQFRLRIAFQVDSADCSRMFGIGNAAPTRLKKFQCVINADLGNNEANIHCQVDHPKNVAMVLSDAISRLGHDAIVPEIWISREKDPMRKESATSRDLAAEIVKHRASQGWMQFPKD